MNALAPDGYARARLLELLAIEPLVPIGPEARIAVAADARSVASGAARASSRAGVPPPESAARFALQVEHAERARFPALLAHLVAALGAGAAAFDPAPGRHTICFGTTPPGGDATLAPPLSTLRRSPAAKRALWRTLRSLRAGRPER